MAKYKSSLCVLALSVLISANVLSDTQTHEQKRFSIPGSKLNQALQEFARQADVQIFYSQDLVAKLNVDALSGDYQANEALALLLDGTGLTFNNPDNNTFVLQISTLKGQVGKASASEKKVDKIKNLEIDEIVVTAQKREQSIRDVPISIVALGDRELKQRGIADFEDLGLSVPGLNVVDAGGAGYNGRRITLRGIANFSGGGSQVGIYLDETSVTGGGTQRHLDLRTYDLERVEVLKGPQGTLYGEGSSGGTIRFITRNPDLEAFAMSTDVSASFTRGGAASQKAQAMVNLPIVEDKFAIRVVGEFDNSGGWIDQPAQSLSNINHENVTNVRVKTLWQPAEQLSVATMVVIHDNQIGAPNQGEDENGNYRQAFDGVLTPTATGDETYEIYNLNIGYDFGSVRFLSSTNYIDQEALQRGLTVFSPVSGPASEEPLWHFLMPSGNTGSETFNQEIRFSSTNDEALQWSVGGFYQDSDHRFGFGPWLFGPLPLPALLEGDSSESSTSESWAVFGEVSYELTQRLEIGGGLRYFKDSRTLTPDAGNSTQAGSFDNISPRLFARYDISDNVTAFANIGKGFRSGGFISFGAPPYGPEIVWSYELGLKMEALGGRLAAEVSAYYSDYTDYIVAVTKLDDNSLISITENAGNAEIRGIDLDLAWQANDRLRLELSGSLIDTQFVSVKGGTTSSFEIGDELPYVAKYQFTVSAIHDFTLYDKSAFARLDYNQQDSVALSFLNLGPWWVGESDVINMMNFTASMEINENLSFGIFAKNLLNDRGRLDPYEFQYTAARARPRTIGLKIAINF